MDFSTVRRKIQQSQYPSFESFNKDILLIFQNCVKYNSSDSVFGKYALQMHKAWKQRYGKIYRTLLPSTTPTVPTEAAQSAASNVNVKPVEDVKPPKVIDGSNEKANKPVVTKPLPLPTPDKGIKDKDKGKETQEVLLKLWKFVNEHDKQHIFLEKVSLFVCFIHCDRVLMR